MGQPTPGVPPNVYGRYETLFRIASGGMAEVYAARARGEAGFQKLVALKRMLPHLTDDERFVTMFMDEGRLAANISSPHVVSTLDLGRAEDGSLFLVMELVVGTTLSTLLRNAAREGASLPLEVGVAIIAQAAQGLHDAHEARTPVGTPLGIVHRDVSPQNILVGTDGRVRITDFGVARALLRRTKTSTGEFKGKLSYFSPEQCADQELDRRSDVFSLGVVAWETLTTRRLFHADNPLAVLDRVTRLPIPSASSVNPAVPPTVAAVIARALERDRNARFESAAVFAHALRDAARSVGVGESEAIAAMVRRYGGDTVERMERQLRQSLSALPPGTMTSTSTPAALSSGVAARREESLAPSVPSSRTMVTETGASFIALEDEQVPVTATSGSHKPSSLPYVLATIVVMVGLAAGAVMSVLALTRPATQAPQEVQVLPRVAEENPGIDDEKLEPNEPDSAEEPANAAAEGEAKATDSRARRMKRAR